MPLNFNADEVCRVASVCSAVRIGNCTPPYLQRFIESRLAAIDSALAERVGALDAGQMDELCLKVRALQRAGQRDRSAEV
jgi:hypothetical protein